MTERKRCQVCGKPTSAQYAPFCSEHCADIDLGRWLTGAYRLPGEAAEDGGDDQRRDEE